jgi:hypothetical protein
MADPALRKIPTRTCELCDRQAIWELLNTGRQVVGYYCGRPARLALEEYKELFE